jgi:hypothetical protein
VSENQFIEQEISFFEWIEPYINLQKKNFDSLRSLKVNISYSASMHKNITEALITILNENKLILARVPSVELTGGWRRMKWVLLQDNIKIAELNDG